MIFTSTILSLLSVLYFLPKPLVCYFLNKHNIVHYTDQIADQNILITIDDVPYGSTADILSVLDKYNTKAGLFVISSYVNDYSFDMLVKAVSRGHTLYNHGKTNSRHASLSDDELVHEITHCDQLIKKVYAKANMQPPDQIYRPGCGIFTNQMKKVVSDLNYKIMLGTVYPHDAHVPFWRINRYYLTYKATKGDVVILHDRWWTVPLLEAWLGKVN